MNWRPEPPLPRLSEAERRAGLNDCRDGTNFRGETGYGAADLTDRGTALISLTFGQCVLEGICKEAQTVYGVSVEYTYVYSYSIHSGQSPCGTPIDPSSRGASNSFSSTVKTIKIKRLQEAAKRDLDRSPSASSFPSVCTEIKARLPSCDLTGLLFDRQTDVMHIFQVQIQTL